MNIFPEQPKTSREDTLRIFPKLSNRNVVRAWIRTNPELEDLKRGVLIEVYRCINGPKSPLMSLNRGVYQDLMAAIMKRERSSIEDAIMDVLTDADEKRKGKQIP